MDRGGVTGVAPPTTSTTSGPDQFADGPGASAETKFPADQYALKDGSGNLIGCSNTNVMRSMANDWAAMKTWVNNLKTGGATNQPLGSPTPVGTRPYAIAVAPDGNEVAAAAANLLTHEATICRFDSTGLGLDTWRFGGRDSGRTWLQRQSFLFPGQPETRALDRRAGRYQRREKLPQRRRQRLSFVLRHDQGR